MKRVICLLLAILLILQPANNLQVYGEDTVVQYKNKFVPEDGKTLVFIGQDDNEVVDYIDAVNSSQNSNDGSIPAGMMIYTNLGDLSAMTSAFQGEGANQSGKMDFQQWIKKYDNITLNIGIWASSTAILQGIVNGEYDDNIKKLASFFKSSDKPIFVRFGYEFDGPWNSYSPELYKRAYCYFVDMVRDTHIPGEQHYGAANNVAFVWHSAAFFRLGEYAIWPGTNYNKEAVEEYITNPTVSLSDWYPGDEYVDWVGISWFAWEHEFQEKTAKLRRDEAVVFAKEKEKPVMIAECAPKEIWQPNSPTKNCCDDGKICSIGETANTHVGDSWDNWYQPLFDYIETNDIKALCYINQDWNAQEMWKLEGGWGNSRVQENQEIFAKWLNKLSESRYLTSTEDLYSQIGFAPVGTTQNIEDGLKVTDYSAKSYTGSSWGIEEYSDCISFNGQYTWAEYNVKVTVPGYYKVVYDYISGITKGATINILINGVQQDVTTTLPLTDTSWVKNEIIEGQTVYFDYPGNYTILFQSPSAGLNLKKVTFEETEPVVDTKNIYLHGKDDLSSDSQNITVTYGAFASLGAPSKAIYDFEVYTDGEYEITYNYGTTINSKYKFYVDNVLVEDSVMLATGDWTRWKDKTGLVVTLEKGKHRVILESPNGSLNLQYLKLTLKEAEEENKKPDIKPDTVKKTQQIIAKSNYRKVKGSKAFYLNAKANTNLEYKTNNQKVATVNSNGKVYIKGYGKATITVTAEETEFYNKVTKKIKITVVPKKVSKFVVKVSRKKGNKKKVSLKWKKDSSIIGYQIQYARNSKFTKGIKTIKIKSKNLTKKVIWVNKKASYFRIRSYVKTKTGVVYSDYCNRHK